MQPGPALLALVLAAPGIAFADQQKADPSYLPELLAAIRTRSLAEERGWLRLGHWRKGLLGGWESEADGPALFLAREGKTDPAAELEATLKGFFADMDAAPEGAVLADP